MSQLSESQWPVHVAAVLRAASTVADLLATHNGNVVLSLEHGWDTTAVVRRAAPSMTPDSHALGGSR
jgi:hypothetical protein